MSRYQCLTCRKHVEIGSGHDCFRALDRGWLQWRGAPAPVRTTPKGLAPDDIVEAFTRCGEILRWRAAQVIWWWDAQDDYNDVLAWRRAA